MEFDAVLLPPRRARMVAQGLWHDRTINDELDACVARLHAIVLAERARLRAMRATAEQIVHSFVERTEDRGSSDGRTKRV